MKRDEEHSNFEGTKVNVADVIRQYQEHAVKLQHENFMLTAAVKSLRKENTDLRNYINDNYKTMVGTTSSSAVVGEPAEVAVEADNMVRAVQTKHDDV